MGGELRSTNANTVKEQDTQDPEGPTASFEADARIQLFGFDPTPATLSLRPRSRSWRVGGAVRTMVVTLIVAPMVAVIPPHAPWLIGVLAGGGFLARRRWREHYTVVGVEGRCPRCGGPLEAPGGRLRSPHPVLCTACHFEANAAVTDAALLENGAGGN